MVLPKTMTNKTQTAGKTATPTIGVTEMARIKNQVFGSYLKQVKGKKLSSNDRANIEAWEMTKKHLSCSNGCKHLEAKQ